ncbi:thymidylate kinase [Sparassis latifolia]|uniref:Thymidylate kinase n=1 Tax=Sparassis crispa TaxID=139825 RepID=A0A401GVS1_9APHY|nr:Thymidylate kinase [Sparassis crispa]GBE86321.1 Thymidylate kinase [Sparassis crispa]
MSERQIRGTFIAIEGLDRSGKSTQTTLLAERLQRAGVETKFIKFPDRSTPIGKMIDAYLSSQTELDDHAIHLLFSANRWELASSIENALRAGTTVICDRYAFSGIAFSAAKALEGLSYEWCRAPDVYLPAPDATLFLNVSLAAAAARGGYGKERYETEDVQARVRAVFDRIGAEVEEAEGMWITIDADASTEEVAQAVWEFAEPFSHGTQLPLRRLWDHLQEDRRRNLELYL